MNKMSIVSLRVTILFLAFFFLSGFTDLSKKVAPIGNEPQGNPDPIVGIVVKLNSTGMDVLADSSQQTRFGAMKTSDKKHIWFLDTPVDLKPHKFTLDDEDVGFTAEEVYFVSITFNTVTGIWSSINFTPYFIPANYKTEAELMPYLDKWEKMMLDAGWEEFKHERWIPHRLPKPDLDSISSQTYDKWIYKNKYQAYLQVKRDTYWNKDEKNPKYNIRFYISNLAQKFEVKR